MRTLEEGDIRDGPVIYWMSRDQRVRDNWALLFSQELAVELKKPLGVVFCLVPQFLGATLRQYGFMLKGLQEVEKNLGEKNIPFFLRLGSPEEEIPELVDQWEAAALVTDFDPLKVKRHWKEKVVAKVNIPVYEVDAHNIVPCWIASPKQEFAAYTFRPKVRKMLPSYLDSIPSLKKHSISWKGDIEKTDWDEAQKGLKVDLSVKEVEWIKPGEKAARYVLRQFVKNKLAVYAGKRNDPNKDALSNLSPYLHFGHISAQRVALEVREASAPAENRAAFLEELIVRRELSDNFCFYNERYDSFEGFPDWARKTLDEHRRDKRDYIYTLKQFERGQTHDDLWNAAQTEMVKTGKMFGYMRMYWAKKILEWTKSPEEALKVAIVLNDKYELDGRDPNGYTGIAWSIGGIHDRAWFPRPVFGKIRYMSYKGAWSKFNVKAYIDKIKNL
jgi:deoxyribodipyrimidine photo-lyase